MLEKACLMLIKIYIILLEGLFMVHSDGKEIRELRRVYDFYESWDIALAVPYGEDEGYTKAAGGHCLIKDREILKERLGVGE
jgi:hypothetical protein